MCLLSFLFQCNAPSPSTLSSRHRLLPFATRRRNNSVRRPLPHRQRYARDFFYFHFNYNAMRLRPSLSLLFFRLPSAGELPGPGWGQATHCHITNSLFEVFYFIFVFISMQCALYAHFPSSIPFAIGRRNYSVCSKFYFVYIVILMQCALDHHQFTSSSSSVAIRRRSAGGGRVEGGGVGGVRPLCRPAARGGGGGHAGVPVRSGGRGEGVG